VPAHPVAFSGGRRIVARSGERTAHEVAADVHTAGVLRHGQAGTEVVHPGAHLPVLGSTDLHRAGVGLEGRRPVHLAGANGAAVAGSGDRERGGEGGIDDVGARGVRAGDGSGDAGGFDVHIARGDVHGTGELRVEGVQVRRGRLRDNAVRRRAGP